MNRKYPNLNDDTLLHIACRQLAYKAAKLAAAPPASEPAGGSSSSAPPLPPTHQLTSAEMSVVREKIAAVKKKLASLPGGALTDIAPPPLILSETDAHLGRPSLATLLGDGAGTADGGVLRGLIQMMGPSLSGSVAGTRDGMGWYRTLSAVAGCLRPGTAAALRDKPARQQLQPVQEQPYVFSSVLHE